MDLQSSVHLLVLACVALAAYTDLRTGKIYDWLTYPMLALGPVLGFAGAGLGGLVEAFVGIAFCGIAPYVAWRAGQMGGGDVKLLAALGGLLGPFLGIEGQFYGMLVASVAALGMVLWRGQLLRTLANMFFLLLNPLLPKSRRRTITRDMQTPLRMGPFILVGTAAAVLLAHPSWWGGAP
ncbi:MAG: A24 family peptidase [Myxococcota bacterium]